MEVLQHFNHGTPSIYDLGNFAVVVILLFACSGLHLNQMRNKRTIADLQAKIEDMSK